MKVPVTKKMLKETFVEAFDAGKLKPGQWAIGTDPGSMSYYLNVTDTQPFVGGCAVGTALHALTKGREVGRGMRILHAAEEITDHDGTAASDPNGGSLNDRWSDVEPLIRQDVENHEYAVALSALFEYTTRVENNEIKEPINKVSFTRFLNRFDALFPEKFMFDIDGLKPITKKLSAKRKKGKRG